MLNLKAFDAFPKVNEDFNRRTLSGGVITLGAALIMSLLFFNELGIYVTTETVNELSVDLSRGDTLAIHFDMTFPALPCEWISLDAMDISGDMDLDVVSKDIRARHLFLLAFGHHNAHDVLKRRLDSNGQPLHEEGEAHRVGPELDDKLMHTGQEGDNSTCGSCYGANSSPEACCNNCEEVRNAYRTRGWAFTDPQHIEQCAKEGYVTKLRDQAGEGCHMWGELKINKVAGNFHFAPGRSFQQGNMHVHDLVPFQTTEFDTSHTVNHLAFGQEFPGMTNPLDKVAVPRVNSHNPTGATGMYQYFLKVVPTVYTTRSNRTISTNQYSVTEHFKPSNVAAGHNLPGVFFFYDLSPIKVHKREKRHSFLHFITSVCAIVGGVFTVSGIIDSFIYHGQQVVRKKVDLGKFS